MAAPGQNRLSLFSLSALVIGSMIGAGIFSLPRTFAGATGPFGALIAWCIAAGGMYTLARVFQALAERKPDLDAGVYAYARAGFGDYPGFLSAFGYWIGSCIGNVFWAFHFTILRGVQQAAFINKIVTIAKVVPIILFVLILIFAFKGNLFSANFWGGEGMPETSLFEQIRATMLVTVFVFLGIEGASVYSRYAKKRSDIGAATIIGFVAVTTLMVLVTLLPYSVLPRAEIAGMRQPSMAAVLESVVGHWGVAAYFATLEPKSAKDGNEELIGAGASIFSGGEPSENVPACAVCHGPDAVGSRNIPRLGGLSYHYLKRRLSQWAQGYHTSASYPMPIVASHLSDDKIEALASYLSFIDYGEREAMK